MPHHVSVCSRLHRGTPKKHRKHGAKKSVSGYAKVTPRGYHTGVAIWNRAAKVVETTETNAALTRAAVDAPNAATLTVPTWADFIGIINEETAKGVPAFLRALRLISGTIANMPLVAYRGAAPSPDQPRLLRQPEPDVPRWNTLENTVEDLVLYGRAYWQVLDLTPQGFPRTVKWWDRTEVGDDLPSDPDYVMIGGEKHPKSDPTRAGARVGDVICFYGFNGGVLSWGAKVLSTASELELAVQRYATSPLPTVTLKNTGADLPTEQVTALLDAWESSRTNRSTAYLNSVIEMETVGWDAAQLQLVEARNQAAVQIARLFGMDASWLNANTPGGGTTLTYTNRVDLRKDLYDFTLLDFCQVIGQRLSMRDVTPTLTSNLVAFDYSEFMRTNLEARTNIIATLLPLGVVSVDEAREFLQFAPDRTDTNPAGGIT